MRKKEKTQPIIEQSPREVENRPRKKFREKTLRNREVYRIAYIFILIFLSLGGYLVYLLVKPSEDILNNSYNSARIENQASYVIRGDIVSADGQVLATTTTDESGNTVRTYPFHNLFSHVVGYDSSSNTGIEELANYFLFSTNASILDRIKSEFTGEKLQGNTVITTLNATLQQVASDALGDNQGAVVALDPKTGAVLAMVSKPDYDPNDIESIWENLDSLGTEESFLVNRATQGQYPPGSTFKLLTTLAYIRQYPDTYMDFTYTCTGSLQIEDYPAISCDNGKVHGLMTLQTALQMSCNTTFSTVGTLLDGGLFQQLCEDFLFNTALPVSIAYNQSSFPVTADSTNWEKMMAAIGQGTTVMSPLHNAMIVAAIANDGVMMTPKFIDRVVDVAGNTVETIENEVAATPITEEEASILQTYMVSVVEEGTAYLAASDLYQVAGKTGSAQYSSANPESTHAWFVGYAPADDPQIAVAVIVEGGGSGGQVAAPIAKQLFDTYLGISGE